MNEYDELMESIERLKGITAQARVTMALREMQRSAKDAPIAMHHSIYRELQKINDKMDKLIEKPSKTLTNCSYEELAKEMWRRCAEV